MDWLTIIHFYDLFLYIAWLIYTSCLLNFKPLELLFENWVFYL